MASAATKRRSPRQVTTLKRPLYVDPDTDEDAETTDEDSDATDDDEERSAKRAKTSIAGRTRSARLSTTDDTETPELELLPPKAVTRRARPRKPVTRSHASSIVRKVASRVGRPKVRSLGKRKPRTTVIRPSPPDIPSDGKIPPWQTLPYETLLQIFRYAYTPGTHTWLIRTARKVCRAFAEPALAAFYQSPTLPTTFHLESLNALVQVPVDRTFINYRVKIRRLELSIQAFVDRKDDAATLDLGSLVTDLPNLSEISIFSLQDAPPYRRHGLPRWKYPTSLYVSLDVNGRKLKSWRWNLLFIREAKIHQNPDPLFEYMRAIHLLPSFQTLQHLELLEFPPSMPAEREQALQVEMASIINLLPNLKSLDLISCDMILEFAENLTQSLTRLRIANSSTLDSDILHAYLSKQGSCQLEELILDHNARLDLAFLPSLSQTCPHLKVLKMDLHYYSQIHAVSDGEAKYQYLLGADEHPVWPATIQEIELIHLQKWSSEGAENLFKSLIDSAEQLPNLRKLILQAHINISWRDRVAFREQWIGRLTRVFLDKSCPNPHLASFKAWRRYNGIRDQLPEGTPPTPKGARRLKSVEVDVQKDREKAERRASDSGSASNRRSKRIAETEAAAEAAAVAKMATAAAPTSSLRCSGSITDAVSISDASSPAASGDWRSTAEHYIQGLCDIVDIRIDNQRPREEQFNENDFLDSEMSGDEDWHEGDEMPDEGYAW